MKRNSKLVMVLVALVLCLSMVLVGCKPSGDTSSTSNSSNNDTTSTTGGSTGSTEENVDLLPFAANTTLRMATGYQKPHQGISVNEGVFTEVFGIKKPDEKDTTKYPLGKEDPAYIAAMDAYNQELTSKKEEGLKLSDGKTYKVGDLKPTWVEVQNRLGMKFEDKWTGAGSAEKEFTYWEQKLAEVDMVSGSASKLQVAGSEGKVIDIAKYLDKMPNFKAYLDANPIVRLSITGSVQGATKGAIYFSPYFDGVNDIERMPLMRVDFVEKLLNGEGEFTATESKAVNTSAYTPYMPTTGTVEVDVVKADASGTEKLVKDYSKYGNIITKMNAESSLTGVQAVNMLREYIDKTYNGYYGNNRADLFVGQNAAWDADELVALLRCVVANPQTLNGTDTIEGFYSREDFNNQRAVDAFRFAGTLFGVRGLESRQDYLYFDANGELHDARQEAATYAALEKMNAMKQEGLISSAFNDTSKTSAKSDNYLKNDSGLMSYDYNQTQTIYNGTKLNDKGADATDTGEKYMAILVPVAKWDDGDSATPDYFRFTESWRSVKTDGWALSKEGIGNDTNKLNAALKLIDYAYSMEGQILMSYGPDSFIKVKNANATTVEEKYETFNFNGQQWPVISDGCAEDLDKLASGNYTNFARHVLGSTLSFAKSQAFEIQCTHEVGKEGAQQISNAIGLGVIKHPELAICDNMWYTSIPTVLPTTSQQNTIINGLTELSSNGKFAQNKDKTNILCGLIAGGYTATEFNGTGITDAATAVTTVSSTWKGTTYLVVKTAAWNNLKAYYNEINK